MTTNFLRPRLVGQRFATHSVPLDVLKDFSAFEEMLVELAKRKYLADNPERKRLPKGFGKNISVNLTGVEDGSAILAFALSMSISGFLPPVEERYFIQAKDSIIEAIAAVEENKVLTLAPELLRYFERFGRSLHTDESIEFLYSDKTVVFSQQTRKKLLEASQAQSWTEEITVKGHVSAVDKNTQVFDIELKNGNKIKAPFTEQYQQTILEAFNEYENKIFLEIKGIALIDRAGVTKSIESIEQVSMLDSLDIANRLEELVALEDGWLDGKGAALNKQQVVQLNNYFDAHYSNDLPLPYLYPTAEGRVQAEWEINAWEVSLEIDLTSFAAEFHAFNFANHEEKELSLTLDSSDGWSELNTVLLGFNEVQA